MSETYAGRGYERADYQSTRLGGTILLVVSSLSAILVLLALFYFAGASARNKQLLAYFGCEPHETPVGMPCVSVTTLRAWYVTTTRSAVGQLGTEAAAATASERRDDRPGAAAALRSEVATENALSSSLTAATFTPENWARVDKLISNADALGTPVPLAAVAFTPKLTVTADVLIKDVQTVAKLTAAQARSSSLSQMRSLNREVDAAIATVRTEMSVLLRAIDVRPTASEEAHS